MDNWQVNKNLSRIHSQPLAVSLRIHLLPVQYLQVMGYAPYKRRENIMDFTSITKPISEDLVLFNEIISSSLDTNVPLIRQIGEYLISSGGKRLRPILTILCAYGAQAPKTEQKNIATLACVIEFLHTSTLLHDDVVDNSALRRNNPTANFRWGNAAPVLVGDFLLSRAFQLITHLENIELLKILSNSTIILAEGEVFQLTHIHNVNLTEKDYFKIIHNKTAQLFEAAAALGSTLGNKDFVGPMVEYASQLGLAFQLIDDVLDYSGSTEEMGKNIGDDLAEGKMTLPLIKTYAQANEDTKKLIERLICKSEDTTNKTSEINELIQIVQESGSIEYTNQRAQEATDKALTALSSVPDSIYKTSLIQIAELSINRQV